MAHDGHLGDSDSIRTERRGRKMLRMVTLMGVVVVAKGFTNPFWHS
jgi:hypothetical protein